MRTQSITVLKPTDEPGVYTSQQTIGAPVSASRAVIDAGATDLPGGGTRFTHVPARVADVGDVIGYRDQYFEVTGVTPQGGYGVLETLDTQVVEGEISGTDELTIGGRRLEIGDRPLTFPRPLPQR